MPDSRQSLHNHPFSFVSIILSKKGYTEYVPDPVNYAAPRSVKRINVKRFHNSYHWISELDQTPTWTLVFVGRRRRVWGYLERDGSCVDFDKSEYNAPYQEAVEARAGGGDLM